MGAYTGELPGVVLAKRDQCRQLEDPDVDRQLRHPGRDQGKEGVGK
jgi:hypothetical protein